MCFSIVKPAMIHGKLTMVHRAGLQSRGAGGFASARGSGGETASPQLSQWE